MHDDDEKLNIPKKRRTALVDMDSAQKFQADAKLVLNGIYGGKAADEIGIPRTTLDYYMKKQGFRSTTALALKTEVLSLPPALPSTPNNPGFLGPKLTASTVNDDIFSLGLPKFIKLEDN